MRPTLATGLTSPPCVGTCVIATSLVRGAIALERGEMELPGCVVADDVDLDPDARFHLQECEIVRQVLGPRGDDGTA
ncbi:MAG TPA: hypothetical protein VE687_18600 [Stellaceae bacterium]|nr:hypothetical protein [Stellaceae bacterium]